ncbi:MAG TPA: ABC transporter permease [Anaerolineales bacterium]|nr:ABC transporter permease [Anaerolineales bacterium]
MIQYITRRVLSSLPVLLGVLFVTFTLARLLPGDPCRAVLGERATDQVCDAFIKRNGLDRPIPVQFGIYLKDVLSGDLGTSLRQGRPATVILAERLPVTIELAFFAMCFATLAGVPLGIISAYRHNSPTDVGTMIFANMGVSTPVFVLGLLLAYTFAVLFKDTPLWLPPSGRLSSGIELPHLAVAWGLENLSGTPAALLEFLSRFYIFTALVTAKWDALADAAKHMILPALAVGTIPLAIVARMTRSSLLDVLSLDYIRTAHAKGLERRTVVLKHGLRNALLPVVTIIGLSLGGLLSGAVLTETVFNLPGVGRTLFESITARDYTVVQAFTLVIAVFYLTVNLVVDVLYAFLDPRIRLS